MKKIRVIELFAGVGGFRLGLDAASGRGFKYETVWSSQWEPGATKQYASEIYTRAFGPENHSCEDIQQVVEKNFKSIPPHDLLVGGFPCQDYSVARTLNQAQGIVGKKGVLWWSIYNILRKFGKKSPDFLMLENVDRLLKSPSGQRGKDFAVMLASLSDLGYVVEWRVINAADYGFPQRRRRVFIMGYKKGSKISNLIRKQKDIKKWICKLGVIAKAFPVMENDKATKELVIEGALEEITEKFSSKKPLHTPFETAGIMIDRKVYTLKTAPKYDGPRVLLKHVVIHSEAKIPASYYINDKDKKRWEHLKGPKKQARMTKDGFAYNYSEGGMVFPDSLERPSRTIVTGEGGSSPSRFKHVIMTKSKRLRRLTPLELERLNTFPPDHTRFTKDGREVPDTKRAFIMGNALVVGVIEKLGKTLATYIQTDS